MAWSQNGPQAPQQITFPLPRPVGMGAGARGTGPDSTALPPREGTTVQETIPPALCPLNWDEGGVKAPQQDNGQTVGATGLIADAGFRAVGGN